MSDRSLTGENYILDNLCCVEEAAFDRGGTGKPDGCHPGTSVTTLGQAEAWTRDVDNYPFFLLQGPAGTGKTAVAQTFSQRMCNDHCLGASFFFSRYNKDRRDPSRVFSTLAVQVAHTYPAFHEELVKMADSPGISYQTPHDQMELLLVQPFQKSGISTIIIIDAIGKCKESKTDSGILLVLRKLAPRVPKVKFFLTSQMVPHIQLWFQFPSVVGLTFRFMLHDVEEKSISDNIWCFFNHKFSELTEHHNDSHGWPPAKEYVDLLCKRAGGLFIFTVATVNFLSVSSSTPQQRLKILLWSPENTNYEGKAPMKGDQRNTLDSLYNFILLEGFKENGGTDYSRVRLVLGTVALSTTSLPLSAVAELLGLAKSEVLPILSSIQPVLVPHVHNNNSDKPIRFYHKSFSDFIMDPNWCADACFCVSTPDSQATLLLKHMALMNTRLEKAAAVVMGVACSPIDNSQDTVKGSISLAL